MKYQIGTKFLAEPVAEFQETSYVEVTDFTSTFDESSMEPEAEYRWEAFDEDGNQEVVEWTDAEDFEEWAQEREQIDSFPWEDE